MDRITNIFAKGKPLVIFTSVGYPTEEQCEQAVCTAIEKGADIIELGVPFSDPMADGPVIAAASQSAIRSGMNIRDRKSTRLNSSHRLLSRMPSSA